jgi:hypothetical protein
MEVVGNILLVFVCIVVLVIVFFLVLAIGMVIWEALQWLYGVTIGAVIDFFKNDSGGWNDY